LDPECGLDFGSVPYVVDLFKRARRERVPLSGTLDLTYRCNFRCVHCYVGHLVQQARSESGELDTGQMVRVLNGAADAGCMFLLLSGGEPLLREDFVQVYTAARRLGMLVTVFTNASLLNEEHLEVFGEYPPRMVEVTLYGASSATYERITGTRGSFATVHNGIERLLGAGLSVGLKSMVLRDNVHEISAMARLAQDLGLPYRVDPLVTPRLDGDCRPLAQRVEPELAAEVEFGIERQASAMAQVLELRRTGRLEGAPSDRLFRCGAGQASFHVGPAGFMHPCLISPGIACDTLTPGFAEAWKTITAAVDRATWTDPGRCATCHRALLCGYCAGLFLLEGVSPAEPPEYLCRLGERKAQLIGVDEPEVAVVTAT